MSLYPSSVVCPVCDGLVDGHHWNENSRCKCGPEQPMRHKFKEPRK